MRKRVFEEVNGLNETDLPICFNDVDLCMRLGERGYRIVWTPYAELYHHESATLSTDRSEQAKRQRIAEYQYFLRRWRHKLFHDPFYNPNLALKQFDFTLAFPPRVKKPWQD